MKLRNLALSVCLVCLVALSATSCSPKAGETKGDAILSGAKTTGIVLAEALDEGIKQEANFAAAGDIDPAIEPQLRQWLQDGKKATEEFNTKAATWTHFDASSKKDITQFASEAVDFVDKMNREGVLRIKNPKSQAIASGIIAGAKVAARLLKSQADSATVEPV